MANRLPSDAEFTKAFHEKVASGFKVQLTLDFRCCWALLSAIQLAFRHPNAKDTIVLKWAVEVARKIQDEMQLEGALLAVADHGWEPNNDSEEDPY